MFTLLAKEKILEFLKKVLYREKFILTFSVVTLFSCSIFLEESNILLFWLITAPKCLSEASVWAVIVTFHIYSLTASRQRPYALVL